MYSQEVVVKLREAVLLLLDCVDYSEGNCRINEQVAAVLPREVLIQVKKILKETGGKGIDAIYG